MAKLCKLLVVLASPIWLGSWSGAAVAANRFAVANANWNLTSTWSATSGGAAGASVPTASDDVFIGETATARAVTIPAAYAAVANSVTLGTAAGVNNAKTLTLATNTSSLAVAGNFTVNKPSSNDTNNMFNVNAGTVTVGGNVTLGGTTGTASRDARIVITTGTLTIGGNLVFVAGVAGNNVIDMSGSSGTINLAGAFTATVGTIQNRGSSVFNYNGANAQTVRIGVSNIIYSNLHLNNTSAGGATLSAAITAANVTANVRVQSGTLNNGGFAVAGGAGDTFQVADGARFNLSGTSAMASGFTTRTFGTTPGNMSTVSFQGANQAVASGLGYGHLNIAGTGTKTPAGGTVTVAGDLTINAGTAFNANPNDPIINVTGNVVLAGTYAASNNAARPLTIGGNLSLTGTYTGNEAPVNLAGNFTRSGTFTSGDGTFTFNGSALQTLTGATTFTNMTVSNTGAGLQLASDITATTAAEGVLTLTGGTIATGVNTLIVPRSCNTPSVSRTGGYVIGNLRKAIPAGVSTCTFEVGSGSNYTPVVAAFVAGTTAGNLTASTTGTEHGSIASSGIDSTKSVNRYWTLTNGGVGLPAAGYTAVFNFINGSPVDFDVGAVPAKFTVKRYSAGWFSTTVNATCTATPVTNLCNQVNGLAGFGDFAIGEPIYASGNAGWFNVFETSSPPNSILGNIYTKLVGTAFSVDVVAVDATRTGVKPGYSTNPITVDLLDARDNSGPIVAETGCRSTWTTVIQTQSVSPVWASSRATVVITAPANAGREVRVQVTQGALRGCSTDRFSIRPTAFTGLSSTDANNSGSMGTPFLKTGANFNLTVDSVAGYDGTPSIDNTKTVGTPNAGTIGGNFGAAAVGTGQATGSTFFYSEVGNFSLGIDGIFDGGFTAVDQANDCNEGSFSNTPDGMGKIGCNFGNTLATATFGRFTPDNFDVSITPAPQFGTVCGTFTYVGQPFIYSTAPVITVTARNGTSNGLTNVPTTNYAGAYMKFSNAAGTSLNQAPYHTQAGRYSRFDALDGGATPALDTSLLPLTTADPTIGSFTNGVGTLTFDSGGGLAFTRSTTAPNKPFNADIALTLNVIDGDGVAYASNPLSFGAATSGSGIAFNSGENFRFGRLKLSNTHGSELLELRIPIEVQYWNDDAVFVTNTADTCTTFNASDSALSFPVDSRNHLAACETSVSMAGGLKLTKPGAGNNGWADLRLNLGATASGTTCIAGTAQAATTANKPYLQGAWTGAAYIDNPSARATFGVYQSPNQFIYMRENY